MSGARTCILNFFILVTFIVVGTVHCGLAAEKTERSDRNETVVKIGVAVLKNTSTRSVPLTFQRDRLVSDINHIKKLKHSKDNTKIEAVALDSSSIEAAKEQARTLGCDYAVFTNLTELRESGDATSGPRPGEIRLGRDPVANDPNVAE